MFNSTFAYISVGYFEIKLKIEKEINERKPINFFLKNQKSTFFFYYICFNQE